MDQLPVFLKLDSSPCLVVGGGNVAGRKVRLLMRAGAVVTVVADELSSELLELRDAGRIAHHAGAFTRRLLDGVRVVIAATDDARQNRAVSQAAERAGVLCNVVDDGAASRFIMPAIVDRSPVVIAIGTGGNAPVLAQRLKSQVEAWLPTRIGRLARQAGRWRKLVRKRFATLNERRQFWQRFFDGPIASHLLANRQRDAERELRLELIGNAGQRRRASGEAWIVGAGPGDPGLVTLRGQQLLSRADVVLYDRLVSREVLDFARKDATLICVGKNARQRSITQEQINALLLEQVRAGNRVCRLKGGDPLVFGRGGEEIIALARAGLPFQVVPGISAAVGSAAYAGIPLTHRGLSSAVVFASPVLDNGRTPDWHELSRADRTLALYMSAGSLQTSVQQLTNNGMPGDTPVAIVENGTTDRQRVLRGTLQTIAMLASAARVRAPATIFVGKTAGLGSELQWFAPDRHLPVPEALPVPTAPRDWPVPGAAGTNARS